MRSGTNKKIAILVDLDNLIGGITVKKDRAPYLMSLVLLETTIAERLNTTVDAISERYAYMNFINASNTKFFTRLQLPITYQVYNSGFPQWSRKTLTDGLLIGKATDLIKDGPHENPRVTDIVLVTGDTDIIVPTMTIARKHQKGFYIASMPNIISDCILNLKRTEKFFNLDDIVQATVSAEIKPGEETVPEEPLEQKCPARIQKKAKRWEKKKATPLKKQKKKNSPPADEQRQKSKKEKKGLPKPQSPRRFKPMITSLVSKKRNGGRSRGPQKSKHRQYTDDVSPQRKSKERPWKIPPVHTEPENGSIENGTLTKVLDVFHRISIKQSVSFKNLRTELTSVFDKKSIQEIDHIILAFAGLESVSIENGVIRI